MDGQIEYIFNLLDDFIGKYDEEKERMPFHFNVIDELHINENANTRILIKLLQYQKSKKYPILESFINNISKITRMEFKIHNPKLLINKGFIDGLIEDKCGKYSIIIENKIYGAVDQNNQIERYIKTENKKGFDIKDIYVIYLTKDGTKKVSDYSLSKETKKKLGDKYISINYENHILPWLKNEITPMLLNEKYISSALTQYIDYLDGLLELRNENIEMKKELNSYLEEKLKLENDSIENYKILSSKISEVEKLDESLKELRDYYVQDISQKYIINKFGRFNAKYNFEISSEVSNDSIYIELINSDWKKCSIVFQTEDQNNFLGIALKNEDKPLSQKVKNKLFEIEDYESNKWWPIWKYAIENLRYINDDFWILVKNGDLERYLKEEISKIMEVVKDNDLKM